MLLIASVQASPICQFRKYFRRSAPPIHTKGPDDSNPSHRLAYYPSALGVNAPNRLLVGCHVARSSELFGDVPERRRGRVGNIYFSDHQVRTKRRPEGKAGGSCLLATIAV